MKSGKTRKNTFSSGKYTIKSLILQQYEQQYDSADFQTLMMRPGSSSRCLKSRWPVTSCRIITTNDASSSSSFCCCQGLKMSLYPDYFCFACSKREPIGSSTLKTCSKCGLAQYCNKECQIKGWTTHKKTCGILKKAFQRSEVATIWEFAEISQS